MRAVRDADRDWPAVGSRLHHVVGIGPLGLIRDDTEVLGCEPPFRLQLHSRARPLGAARVTLLVEPAGPGSRVTLIEQPAGLRSRVLMGPAARPLLRARNDASLRRLRALAEARG